MSRHDPFEKITDKLLRDLIEEVRKSNRLAEVNSSQEREQTRILERILHAVEPRFPTSISFKGDSSMLPPVAGNTLVYTGTLSPAGAVYPSDTTFTLVSSDPTVTPTVDVTGLIVTIPLPATFVDNPATPFNVVYTAASVSAAGSITATITPSAPAVFPTGVTFAQTT
jgi:hypothetical protein